jgi:hypothetical protein
MNIDTPTGIAVLGGDVYVAGTTWVSGGSGASPKPYLWINGAKNELSSSGHSYARAIAVSGTDVYVAGEIGGRGAYYWKNGTKIDLAMGYRGHGYAIMVIE